MRGRAAALAGLVTAIGVAAMASQRQAIWRAAYPSLPPRLQAAPYRVAAVLRGPRPTGAPLPTAAIGTVPEGPTAAIGAVPEGPTPGPSVGPFAAVSPTPSPPPATLSLPPTARLTGFNQEYQTWNNCGPATVSMALGHFGVGEGQAAAARALKPDPDDKNVSPDELARYARERGLGAMVRYDGDLYRLRTLIALGVPVIVETWFEPEPGDQMGHYRLLIGYSDAEGQLVAMDAYNGPEVPLAYAAFDALWRVFNRVYVPVYPAPLAEAVRQMVGEDIDDRTMFAGAVARAEADLIENADAFGWFNLGSSLHGLGDDAGAASAYDRAREAGLPWRMLWYQFGPFEAYAAEGRWDDVRVLADANLRQAPNLEESLYWRGRALEARGDYGGARRAWQAATDAHPGFEPAVRALASLAP